MRINLPPDEAFYAALSLIHIWLLIGAFAAWAAARIIAYIEKKRAERRKKGEPGSR